MVIIYCPGCGANYDRQTWIRINGGQRVMCGICGRQYDHATLSRTRLKLDTSRVITAAVYLTAAAGSFTRSELAGHLQVTNSPRLRDLLASMAMRGLLACTVQPHPRNGSLTYFYRRDQILTARTRSRSLASGGRDRR